MKYHHETILQSDGRRNGPHVFASSAYYQITTYLYTIYVENARKHPTASVSRGCISVNFFLTEIQNTPNEKEEFIVVGLASTLVAVVELLSETPRVDTSNTALDVLRLLAVISWIS